MEKERDGRKSGFHFCTTIKILILIFRFASLHVIFWSLTTLAFSLLYFEGVLVV